MTEIILTSAKYLIIILFAYFVYISFRAQRDVPDEKKRASFILQRVFIILIHALAYLCICINITLNPDISLTIPKTIGLYCGQLVYLVLLSCVIPKLVSLSKGLNNVMCMFIAIGFIMQTRLDFDGSVRQFFIIFFGTVVFLIFVFLCKRAKFLRNLTWIYAAVGMILLLLVLILATVTKGAKLALDLGFFSFQPMEFVKIIFVMFVASAFYKSNSFKTVLITAICAAIHVLIVVFCKDLGSALILSIIYILMIYVATKKLIYIGIGAVGLAVAAFIAYQLFDHVQTRILIWMNPWDYIDDKGYQIVQSLFAIGTGGWFGSGIFRGSPRYIPEVSNDMVFSAISEELGAIFSILLIMLTLCFILMIMRVAIRVNNVFYKLMAFGLGAAYAIQVFLTIGGAVKFIPLTGVNLPFISSGGSSLLASMVFIGIVQALYVISEADVEREREMIADGADISEFEGYQSYKRKTRPEKVIASEPQNVETTKTFSNKVKIQQIHPDDYRVETIDLHKEKIIRIEVDNGRIQKVEPEDDKIIQIDPKDF